MSLILPFFRFSKNVVCYPHKRYMYKFVKYSTNLFKTKQFTITNSQDKQPESIFASFSTQKLEIRKFSKITGPLDAVAYENVVEETLESLGDYIDELLTTKNEASDSDVTLGDGVLTVNLGNKRGIYVINKQTPNKQIWLSSPISGPKRYDFIEGRWIYTHDGVALHDLLTKEFSKLLNTNTDFTKCAHG